MCVCVCVCVCDSVCLFDAVYVHVRVGSVCIGVMLLMFVLVCAGCACLCVFVCDCVCLVVFVCYVPT